jgi:hypothetical protein
MFMFAQVPLAVPVSEAAHAWQVPLHAVLQQKLFTQRPLAHCEPMVQGVPLAAPGRQVPDAPGFMHWFGDTQSATDVHAVLHAVLLAQRKPPGQAPEDPATHVPVPLHVAPLISVLPEHAAAPHVVPVGRLLQAEALAAGVQTWQALAGSTWLAAYDTPAMTQPAPASEPDSGGASAATSATTSWTTSLTVTSIAPTSTTVVSGKTSADVSAIVVSPPASPGAASASTVPS